MNGVARINKAVNCGLTSQQLADFALQADQDRRRAMRTGNHVLALQLEAEVDELAAQIQAQSPINGLLTRL